MALHVNRYRVTRFKRQTFTPLKKKKKKKATPDSVFKLEPSLLSLDRPHHCLHTPRFPVFLSWISSPCVHHLSLIEDEKRNAKKKLAKREKKNQKMKRRHVFQCGFEKKTKARWCVCVCEWLNLCGKGNNRMSRGPDEGDGEVKPMCSIYTKRMQQQTNVFSVRLGADRTSLTTLTLCPIKRKRPRVARMHVAAPLTVASRISIALMTRKKTVWPSWSV